MDDLVQRLRATADTVATTNHSAWFLYTQTADRIEELEAMYNNLGHSSMQAVADLGTKLGTAEARIERLKGYAVHDDTCEDNGAYPGSCTCGLSRLLKEIGDD